MQQNWFRSTLIAFALTALVPGIASAHAVVFPKQVTANSYEKFALRVPTEKEVPTVKVKVEIPEGFQVSRVQPLPGWTYTFEKDASGKVTAITWSGGEIGPTEFQEFVFQGKAPANAGKFAWKAIQTYKDGSVVEWTGPSDAKTPASVVEVTAGGAQTDAHGHGAEAKPAESTKPAETGKPAEEAKKESKDPVTTGAAWGGLALGAVALILALRKK
jgi:uncharacterized protein YcnI